MGYIQRTPEEFIDSGAYEKWMTRGFPREGDVLFTTEAPLGNVAQLDTDETVVIGQRLITLQPDERVLDKTFLKFALMSSPTQKAIFGQKTGATVLGIKAKLLKQIPISFPVDVRSQEGIAAEITEAWDYCERLKATYQRKVENLTAAKHSILQAALGGYLPRSAVQASRTAA
jgi:type I restriction enzyme, S subunit